jgi:heme/copper-type cytochrome/quinol oxidase subunit 2
MDFQDIDFIKNKQRRIDMIKLRKRVNIPKILYMVFVITTIFALMTNTVFAEDIWTKAKEIMMDVYNQVLLISTVAAVVTSSIALLLMNFSKSGKTVDESRAWLKRIAITWAILNSLGFIMSYVVPFFSGGKWAG